MLLVLALARDGLAHRGAGAASHQDPELLGFAWTQAHLAIQWVHLVTFGAWFGTTAMVLALNPPALRLRRLLYLQWFFLLILLGSGAYNMRASGALPDPPSLFYLNINRDWDFGASYTWLMTGKHIFFAAAILLTFWASLAESRSQTGGEDVKTESRLRRHYLVGQTVLGSLIVIAAAGVLLLHEAVDIAPTPLHSLGGVAGPRGGHERDAAVKARTTAGDPYGTGLTERWDAGFRLLGNPRAARDFAGRVAHLTGFGLWLGLLGVGLSAGPIKPKRFLGWAWGLLAVQTGTGVYGMQTWAPFDQPPYIWRLSEMVHYRFGRTYTLLMGTKQALIAGIVLILLVLTFRQARSREVFLNQGDKGLIGTALVLTLLMAYSVVALLLVHEGVDHAL